MDRQHEEQLLLDTCLDLFRRLQSRDPYSLLMSAALLRKLVLDDRRLVDAVNRYHKLKIRYPLPRFREGAREALFGGFDWSLTAMPDVLDPDLEAPFLERAPSTKDELLRYAVVTVEGTEISVRDMLSFEANVMGGVHIGSPRSPSDHALADLRRGLLVRGHRVSLQQMIPIIKVVLAGPSPLVKAVKGSQQAGRAPSDAEGPAV